MKWRMLVPGMCLAIMAMLMTPSTLRAYKLTVVNDCNYKVRADIYMNMHYGAFALLVLEPHTQQEVTTGAWCLEKAAGEWRDPLRHSMEEEQVSFGVGYHSFLPRCFDFTIRIINYGAGCGWDR